MYLSARADILNANPMPVIDSISIFGAKYLYLAAVVITLVWFGRLPKEKKRETLWFGAIALPAIYLVAKIGSWLYVDPRPFVVGHFTPLIPHTLDNGFPSDHTLLVSALAAVIFPLDKKVSAIVWVLAALVGASRVYAGVHHPIDILGSLAISAAVAAFVHGLLSRRSPHGDS